VNKPPFARNAGLAASALLASSATLVCCVLPALLVALGAGAALAGLITAVPQLIWLSEHKPWVFTIAAILLGVSGIALWVGRRAPCPADPQLARSCKRLRRISAMLYAAALGSFLLGAAFAFLLPILAYSGDRTEGSSRRAVINSISVTAVCLDPCGSQPQFLLAGI
jgi:hypothetical protein